jgi:hypothetical protein
MIINDIKYCLPLNNYLQIEDKKTQIVLGNTFNHDMRHVFGWLHRYNGKYKKTASFTVDNNGLIYKHFEPKYKSSFFGITDLDDKSIVILLENDGWLVKNNEKNEFISSIGYIYNKPDEVVNKKWRGYDYWCPYNEKQIASTVDLVKMLCNNFNIPMTSINHNTKIDNLFDYTGVLYKSNLGKNYTDLNPSFNCEEFKNKIELI